MCNQCNDSNQEHVHAVLSYVLARMIERGFDESSSES